MDGHGVNGHDVSGLMKRRLAPALSKEPSAKVFSDSSASFLLTFAMSNEAEASNIANGDI